MSSRTFSPRFWDHVDRSGGDGACWPWRRSFRGRGYGQTFYRDSTGRVHSINAHRAAYWLTHGPVEVGMHVCHTCDNRACCNPSHLFVGTAADNNADRARKGRSAPRHKIWAVQHPPKGERNGRAKLTEGDVREARALHKSGMTTQEIAKQFSVSNGTIWFIVSGVNWTHVE